MDWFNYSFSRNGSIAYNCSFKKKSERDKWFSIELNKKFENHYIKICNYYFKIKVDGVYCLHKFTISK